jgi:NADH-quinone oxidoreductase subunit G
VFRNPSSLPDLRVLAGIAEEMDVELGFRTVEQARVEMTELGPWDGARPPVPELAPREQQALRDASEVLLATWKLLIDDGRMLDGDEFLKATARRAVALVSARTLSALGIGTGQLVTITGNRGSIRLPVAVADLPDGVVWVPSSSGGIFVSRDLGTGSVVRLDGGQ